MPPKLNTARQTARRVARHGALDLLSLSWQATGRTETAVSTPRVHFPYLHAVPEHEEGRFRSLLEWLARTHTFIGYSEAVDRVLTGRVDKPYVAFSFDDGFASNVRTARLLEEYDATGCFFVVTDFLGIPTLSEAREFFGYVQAIDEPAMTWSEVEDLKARGHEIGNHTRTHRQVSDLSHDRMVDEIGTAADTLRSRLGDVKHFAWPFGRFGHFTPEAVAEVFDTGHASCASAERGAHVPGPVPERSELCIRRDHMMTSWPLRHSEYLLARSAASATSETAAWPAGWRQPA